MSLARRTAIIRRDVEVSDLFHVFREATHRVLFFYVGAGVEDRDLYAIIARWNTC